MHNKRSVLVSRIETANMKKANWFFLTGFFGLAGILIGAWEKIVHLANANFLLTIGFVFFGIFYIMTIWDLLNRPYKHQNSRMLWLLIVLLFPLIGALIYHW